jgi:Cupin
LARDDVDVLSLILRELRFESVAYRWLELGSPFRVGFDQPSLRGDHIVAQGCCVLVGENAIIPLAAGGFAIFPRDDAHLLRSPGGSGTPVVSGCRVRRIPGPRARSSGAARHAGVRAVVFGIGRPSDVAAIMFRLQSDDAHWTTRNDRGGLRLDAARQHRARLPVHRHAHHEARRSAGEHLPAAAKTVRATHRAGLTSAH